MECVFVYRADNFGSSRGLPWVYAHTDRRCVTNNNAHATVEHAASSQEAFGHYQYFG